MSEIGVPVVTPSKTPERILTRSGSRRCVVKRDWPGLRRSSQYWISLSASGMRGGVPSTTQPMAGPWLSPQVVNRKTLPKLLPATRPPLDDGDIRRVHRLHADDVIAAIDVVHLAGDARAQIAQQIEPGAADLLDRDVALERRVVLIPFENIAEVADARGGERDRKSTRLNSSHPSISY